MSLRNRFVSVFLLFFLFVLIWSTSMNLKLDTKPQKIQAEKRKICHVQHKDRRNLHSEDTELPVIYFVTPTYPRAEQVPELTRLSHTLMHVPKIHWIVADDRLECSPMVENLMLKTKLPFTYLISPKPVEVLNYKQLPKGVSNRRAALAWIKQNIAKGVLYFGDDDNTVDLKLFEEIRYTKKVSMFPVGLIGEFGVSSPVVVDGKVVGFFDSWVASRIFPVDMAGFAVNIEHLPSEATMPYIAGMEEDRFLRSAGFKLEDIEPLADNCTKVLVWHTKTTHFKPPMVKLNLQMLENNDSYEHFSRLLNEVATLGMAVFNGKKGNKPFVAKDGKALDIKLQF